MKRYLYVVMIAVLCLALIGCENTDNDLSSGSSLFDYSSYSAVQSDEASDITSDISSTESLQTESSSEAQTSSVQSATPESSSTPAPTQTSVPQSTQSSSKPTPPACKHNYSLTKCTATCVANGQNVYTCSLCGNSYQEQAAALGHKMNGHKCSACGMVDEDKRNEKINTWFATSYVEENLGKYYHLPSDSKYSFSAIGGGNFLFYYDDEEKGEHISVSVYGFEKNKCYITYIQNNLKIEGEFPMDAVHSSDRNFFNTMNADSNEAEAKKSELISALRGKIDSILKKFETEMLIPNTSVTLDDLGFTCY